MTLCCEPDPKDYDNLRSPKCLVSTPRWVGRRIKETREEVERVVRRPAEEEPPPPSMQRFMDEFKAIIIAKRGRA